MWTAPRITNGYLSYDVFFDGLFYKDPGKFVFVSARMVINFKSRLQLHNQCLFEFVRKPLASDMGDTMEIYSTYRKFSINPQTTVRGPLDPA